MKTTEQLKLETAELELLSLGEKFNELKDSEQAWAISSNQQMLRAEEAEADAKRWRRIAIELAEASNLEELKAAAEKYRAAKEGKPHA